jgi:hypothetical protein
VLLAVTFDTHQCLLTLLGALSNTSSVKVTQVLCDHLITRKSVVLNNTVFAERQRFPQINNGIFLVVWKVSLM